MKGSTKRKWRIRHAAASSLAAVLLLWLTSPSWSAPTSCPGHFLAGTAPDLLHDALNRKTRELCFSGFAVLHSGLTRTPLWSAERLTAERVRESRKQERVNRFHAEEQVPADERAELADYEHSGYDRGHMAPSADFPDAVSQAESFSLANMVPQNGELNRGIWAGIEASVRRLAAQHGEVFVVTGPVFQGSHLKTLRGRVFVPTAIYKAVYIPSIESAGAYLADNSPDSGYRIVSLSDLSAHVGIDLFPSLPSDVRASPANLPEPSRLSGVSRTREVDQEGWRDLIAKALDLWSAVFRMLR